MTKVYVPQVPSRFDRATGLWVPTVNLQSADQYGEVVELLPPEANRMHIAPLVAAMKERLSEITDQDWLVAVGDPSLIAAAAAIASRKCNGMLRVLKWDRISSSYIAVEVQI